MVSFFSVLLLAAAASSAKRFFFSSVLSRLLFEKSILSATAQHAHCCLWPWKWINQLKMCVCLRVCAIQRLINIWKKEKKLIDWFQLNDVERIVLLFGSSSSACCCCWTLLETEAKTHKQIEKRRWKGKERKIAHTVHTSASAYCAEQI